MRSHEQQIAALFKVGGATDNVDFSRLPPLVRFDARNRQAIAYRTYPSTSASPKGTVILIHGSSARSDAVGKPRIVGLTLLNKLGIKLLNDLRVAAFALNAAEREFLTPSYSFGLASNFRPHDDYRADLRRAIQPMEVLVGQGDEVFRAERFPAVFEQAGRPLRVTIVPGVSHIGLTVQPAGIEATVSAVGSSAAAFAPPKPPQVPTPK